MVSPRMILSFSMVSGWRTTTELSSLVASSTTRRLAAFFRSKIVVLKSLFVPLLKFTSKSQIQHNRTYPLHKSEKRRKLKTEIGEWRSGFHANRGLGLTGTQIWVQQTQIDFFFACNPVLPIVFSSPAMLCCYC